jgi:ComF family protein
MRSRLLNFLFPSLCPACNSPSDNHTHNPICVNCWTQIARYKGPACTVCGLPTISEYTRTCGECLSHKPPFEKIGYFGIYEGPLKESIHLYKFNNVKRLAAPLAQLLSPIINDAYDAVVPVPMHISKLRKRKFNQTALLGLYLARHLAKPLILDALIKTRETSLQTEVNGRERRLNLKGAFSASRKIIGLRLLLIDDVITTGATIKECAFTLRKEGAASVDVVALARSMPKLTT